MKYCPLCTLRITERMIASGRTEEIAGDRVHRTCIEDYKLRLGLEYRLVREKAHKAGLDWSIGLYET